MSDAPERIILQAVPGMPVGLPDDLKAEWQGQPIIGRTNYIRADLVDDLIDAAAAQLAYMDMCNDRGDLERNLRAALGRLAKEHTKTAT